MFNERGYGNAKSSDLQLELSIAFFNTYRDVPRNVSARLCAPRIRLAKAAICKQIRGLFFQSLTQCEWQLWKHNAAHPPTNPAVPNQ